MHLSAFVVIVPSGPLLQVLICASQTDAIGRIFAIVSNSPLFPKLIWTSETDPFDRTFCKRGQ